MNSLVINIFVVLLGLCILVNLTTAVVLSDVSCRYSGSFDSGNEICHKDVVKVEKLPESCNSFVFDGIRSNLDGGLMFKKPEDGEHLSSLLNLKEGFYPVFLFYTHGSIKDWTTLLTNGDFSTEAQHLKRFIDTFPVKGLILQDIDNLDLFTGKNFYLNFKNYIMAIKSENPNLTIGLYLSAKAIVEKIGVNSKWFDFSKMNSIVDFYLIEFATFNDCNDNLLQCGITPYDSTDPNINTLSKFEKVFKNSKIDNQKSFFEFLISPMPKPEEKNHFKPCEISYNEYCENRDDYSRKWCIDDNNILYKKGQFAKQFSKGFVARDIDLVDRDNKCECDDKYITFSILLNGYNDIETPTCDALTINY